MSEIILNYLKKYRNNKVVLDIIADLYGIEYPDYSNETRYEYLCNTVSSYESILNRENVSLDLIDKKYKEGTLSEYLEREINYFTIKEFYTRSYIPRLKYWYDMDDFCFIMPQAIVYQQSLNKTIIKNKVGDLMIYICSNVTPNKENVNFIHSLIESVSFGDFTECMFNCANSNNFKIFKMLIDSKNHEKYFGYPDLIESKIMKHSLYDFLLIYESKYKINAANISNYVKDHKFNQDFFDYLVLNFKKEISELLCEAVEYCITEETNAQYGKNFEFYDGYYKKILSLFDYDKGDNVLECKSLLEKTIYFYDIKYTDDEAETMKEELEAVKKQHFINTFNN